MEERDFANKSPFLDNFSGDPFRYVHEVKTKQRQPIKEAAKLRLSEDYSTAGGSKIILQKYSYLIPNDYLLATNWQ